MSIKQGNQKCLSSTLITKSTTLLYMTSCVQKSSNWEKGIFLIRLRSVKSALCYQANILWYVLMNYHHFDLKCLSQALTAPSELLQTVRLCVMLTSPSLWTQYPLLLLDRRSIKMRLCFILLEFFDVQRGNCLSLVLCYCVVSTPVTSSTGAKVITFRCKVLIRTWQIHTV